MNIKRIIREEIDDWGWARDIPIFQPTTDYIELKVGDRVRVDGKHQNAVLRDSIGTIIEHYNVFDSEFDVANTLYVHFDNPIQGGAKFEIFRTLRDKCQDGQCYYFDYIPKNKEIYYDDFNRRKLDPGIIEEIFSEDEVLKNREDLIYSNDVTISKEL